MLLSQKGKKFSQFFFNFLNIDRILKNFEKQMTLIAEVFVNLLTWNDVVR